MNRYNPTTPPFTSPLFFSTLISIALLNVFCQNKESYFGTVSNAQGDIKITSSKVTGSVLKKGSSIYFEDTISTEDGTAAISFDNSSLITLEENTSIVITESTSGDTRRIIVSLLNGGILSDIKHPKKIDMRYEVITPASKIESQGTLFYVSHHRRDKISNVHVYDGRVLATGLFPLAVPVIINPGFSSVIAFNTAPHPPQKINYGQFKKLYKHLPPKKCKQYIRHFSFPIPVAPLPIITPGSDKHSLHKFKKGHPDMIVAPVPVPVPVPVPSQGPNHQKTSNKHSIKDGQGKKEKKN